MRNISSASLALLTQQMGGEPLIFIKVFWSDTLVSYYADKTIPEWGIAGKIITLSEFENVVNLSGSSNSQAISIALDDVDGTIKDIFNNLDIHKRPVQVFQWFTGLHIDQAFLIFEGVISSPIVWKEGDRTVSFELVSKLEDQEVGFSLEEGDFTNVPYELVGKAWPLPFGTCIKMPVLKLDPIPTGATQASTLVPDPSIADQLAKLSKLIGMYGDLALLAFYTALSFYARAAQAPGCNVLDPDEQLHDQGDQYQEQGNQYLHDQWKAQQDFSNLAAQRARQNTARKTSMPSAGGSCFPQNKETNVSFGGADHKGSFNGNTFNVTDSTHPSKNNGTASTNYQTVDYEDAVLVGGQETIEKLDYFWIKPGQVIYVKDDIPVRYIVAMLPCTVLNVWSKRDYGGTKIDTQVPHNYYSVGTQSFGSIVATIITLPRPLSHYEGQGWDDEIFVDVASPVGPNTVDIMTWIITNYTTLGIDAASFNTVRSQLAPFPSNFCLFDRPDVVQCLTQIAYLARCAIWMKDNVFYLRYLVVEPASVDTITLEDDILSKTLEVSGSSTEELVTKMIGTYKTDYSQTKDLKIIIRNNIGRYGTSSQETSTTDWFIYNSPNMVQLAMTYWSIRKSNSWKLVKFSTPIHKLRLETFDCVTLNFTRNYVANGPVKAIIESVKFDSKELELLFECWVPVRMGEMTVYPWGWPDSTIQTYNGSQDFSTTPPGEDAEGDLAPINGACDMTIKVEPFKHKKHGSQNPGETTPQGGAAAAEPNTEPHETEEEIDWSEQEAHDLAEAEFKYGQPARPPSDYNYRNYRADQTPIVLVKGTFPGQIIEHIERNFWRLKVFVRGVYDENGTEKRSYRSSCRLLNTEITPIAGQWVVVMINEVKAQDDSVSLENTFIMPAGGGNAFPGEVMSGSGATYQVKIYKKGFGNPDGFLEVEASQMAIHADETIPAGSPTIIVESTLDDGTKKYDMQFPVWM